MRRAPRRSRPPEDRALDIDALARHIVDDLAEKQAENVVLLDVHALTDLCDYFIIAGATSRRQFGALAEAIIHAPAAQRPRREGSAESGWELFDFGDIVVHLFDPDSRAYYDLEGLWAGGPALLPVE